MESQGILHKILEKLKICTQNTGKIREFYIIVMFFCDLNFRQFLFLSVNVNNCFKMQQKYSKMKRKYWKVGKICQTVWELWFTQNTHDIYSELAPIQGNLTCIKTDKGSLR